MKFIRIEGKRIGCLLALAILLFGLAWDRVSPGSWNVPINYTGDALQFLTWVKAASEGEYYPAAPIVVDRLGAPFGANWNDYPMYEKTLTVVFGFMARMLGLFAAANLAALSANLSAVLSFYLVCRYLRFRWEWAFAGAILFGFTYFHTWRGLQHLLLAFSYTLPLAILSVAFVAKGARMSRWNARSKFCVGIAVLMGISNPYNLNIYLQLLCGAILAQWLSSRRKENLIVGGISALAACAAFLIVNAGTFIHRWRHGPNQDGVIRAYYESEQFGLKLIECVMPPPGHNIALLGDIGQRYDGLMKIPGETFSAYLGIAALASLVWIALATVKTAADRKRGSMPAHGLQIAWIYFYAAIGGLNCVVAFGGFQLFRATNRYSIFISTLALLFLVSRLSRVSVAWPRVRSLALAGALLIVGVVDQLPLRSRAAERETFVVAMENDRSFVERMESELNDGAMVFELPVMGFPEAKPIPNIPPYELIRLYLHSGNLRFSHGYNKGRPLEHWQKYVELASPKEMLQSLESFGFSAIVIHRNAYPDRGESLLGFLRELGRSRSIEDAVGDRVCVFIKPAATPVRPNPADYPWVEMAGGFSRWDRTVDTSRFWSSGDARLNFRPNEPRPGDYLFTGGVSVVRERRVTLKHNGQPLWSQTIKPGSPGVIAVRFRPDPEGDTLEFDGGLNEAPPSNVDGVLLSVGLVNPRIRPAAASEGGGPKK